MSLGRMQSLKTWPSVSYLRAVRHPPVTSSSSLPSPHTFSLGLPVVRASLSDPTSCWASACLWLCVRCLEQWQPIKEIKPVNPKGNQLWIFIGKTDAEAKALILWPPDANIQLFGKDPDAGKDWRQEKKRVTEDEMVGWHHQFNGNELGKIPGDGEGQGGLVCCSPWGSQSRAWLSDWTATTTTWSK